MAVALRNGGVVEAASNCPAHGHAEARLLERLRRADKPGRVDVLVVRVANTSGEGRVVLRNSRPCAACRAALLGAGVRIRYVMWSTDRDTVVGVRLGGL